MLITIWEGYVGQMLSSSCYKWSSWNQVSSFKEKTMSQTIYGISSDNRLTFAMAWFSKSGPQQPTSFLLQVGPSRSLSTMCLYLGSGANVLSRVLELWASGDTWSHLDWLGIVSVIPQRDGSTGFLWSSSLVHSLVRRTCSRRCLEEGDQIVKHIN